MLVRYVLYGFLGISVFLLGFAGNLFAEAFGFMLFASYRPAGLFLDFSCDVFRGSFHSLIMFTLARQGNGLTYNKLSSSPQINECIEFLRAWSWTGNCLWICYDNSRNLDTYRSIRLRHAKYWQNQCKRNNLKVWNMLQCYGDHLAKLIVLKADLLAAETAT